MRSTTSEISESVKQFVFEYIDSVEQLDILLFLRLQKGEWFCSNRIGAELRLNINSVQSRLISFHAAKLIDENPDSSGTYSYLGQRPEIESVLEELSMDFRVKKHRILELIFSPAKRAKHFANAFSIGNNNNGEGGENG